MIISRKINNRFNVPMKIRSTNKIKRNIIILYLLNKVTDILIYTFIKLIYL